MDIDESTRAYLTEMRALAVDSSGSAHLVGLTPAESAHYLAYSKARMSNATPAPIDGEQYLELHEKHERARLGVIMAENQLRVDRPPIQ